MTLRAKVLAAGVCTAAVILCLTYSIAHAIVLRSFEALETRQTREHGQRAIAALVQRADHLAVTARDWAAWDDTYAFAHDHSAQYIARNLTPSTLTTLDLDVLAYVDASGDVVHVLESSASEGEAGLGASLIETLFAPGRPPSSGRPHALSGTVRLPQGLVLMASHPILRGDLSGPSRGTLVMARLLDDEQIALLSDTARLPIEVLSLDTTEEGERGAEGSLSSAAIDVRILDHKTVEGSAPLYDIWGKPVATLRIGLPRDVYDRGRNTVMLFLVALALGTILPIGAALLVFDRRVARPVAQLSAFVDGMRKSGNLGARIASQGCKEIASLGGSINALLEALMSSEQGLQRSEERYRSLVENLQDVIYTIDQNGTVTYASPAISTIIGLAPGEAMGQSFTRLVHPEDHERTWRGLKDVLAGKSCEDECRLMTTQGDVRWVRFSAYPQTVEGHVIGLQGILTDVTERRHLEEQLHQAQKMDAIGQLAEGIAHDFNNLLTIISGYAATTLRTMGADDPRREDILEIHRAGQRGAALTRRLLTFGRQRMGSPQVIALRETLADTSDMLRRLMGSSTVALDLPDDPLYVQAEPGQIEQILMNLAINARDAMGEGGTLTIRAHLEPVAGEGADPTSPQGRSAVLTVQDTGCGMTPEVLQHAFEPFFTTKGAGKGTGLGLATVYGIVRQNRGTVTLDTAPGRGTTVTIRLPAVPAPAASEARAEPGGDALPGGAERVLLVEDQHEVRRLTHRMLQHMGYQVEAWASPAEALARYEPGKQRVDLVLSDVAMPEMNGPQLVARLKERSDGGAPFAVVYMSGYAEEGLLRRSAMGPYERFLQKPFTAEQLAAAVRSALDNPRTRQHQPEIAA